MATLVTGAAGFIGFHTSKRLLERGDRVVGLDNINDYYDVSLKQARLEQLKRYANFSFFQLDLADRKGMEKLFAEQDLEIVINLAAQAGVRYSLQNPHAYIDSNLVGFMNILEGCRYNDIKHLVFASSSSVYGTNKKIPFSVEDNVDYPISIYAATKKANELMAHTYSHLYDLPATGLRFFTVYGPWGRPDMALFLFTKAILEDRPINVFNYGKMQRDFTYVDDVVEGVIRVSEKIPDSHAIGGAKYKVYNIGNNQPVELMYMIQTLEKYLGKTAAKNMMPIQPGDVPRTYADIDELIQDVGFRPNTPIEEGIQKFVDWYREYYSC